MREYPWLPPAEFHDTGETAAGVMKPAERLVVIEQDESGITLKGLKRTVDTHRFHSFPVLLGDQLLGYTTRDSLIEALAPLIVEDENMGEQRRGTFASPVRLRCEYHLSFLPTRRSGPATTARDAT